jgi:alkylation response protein AidB-like acyl-CoA dehydrogenase
MQGTTQVMRAEVDEARRDTPAEILQKLEQLVPTLRSRFRETEQLGCVPDSTIADLEGIGLMRLLLPVSMGGAGGGLRDFSNAIRILAHGDTTLAWTVGFLVGHNWMLARWNKDAQDEVFRDRGFASMTSVNLPPGVAKRVDGGYRLTGRWQYGSCILNADWVQVMGKTEDRDDILLFLLPRSETEVINTWHVMGMKGTGSNDIKITDAFVPDHRVDTAHNWGSRKNAGSFLHPEPLYHYETRDVNVFNFPSLALGGAEAVVDLYRERLEGRPATPFMPSLGADLVPSQMRFAKATALIRTARATLNAALALAEEVNRDPDAKWSVEMRSNIKLDQLSVLQISQEAIQLIMAGSGGSVYKESDYTQHVFRDVQTASGHVSLNQDYYYAKVGENLLGRAKEADPVFFFF